MSPRLAFFLVSAALGLTVAVSGQTSTFTPFSTSATAGGLIPIASIATGTCNSTTYVRGDGTCAAPSGSGDVVSSGASTDNAITRYNGTSGTSIQTSLMTIDDNGTLTAVAAATGYPSMVIPAGTLQTTPSDGGFEADGDAVYAATDAGNRGVLPLVHYIRADSTRTFTSNTSEQAIFTSPASGALTLETGLYMFDGLLNVGTMSATSGNGAIDPLGAGTATIGSWLWHVVGVDGNTATAATQTGSTMVTQQTPASAVTAGTGTAMTARMTGSFEVTGAGTIIPSFTMVTANASVVAVGSYFRVWRVGSTTTVSVGQWQ